MNEQVNKFLKAWMNKQINEWMNESMNEWINECTKKLKGKENSGNKEQI